MDSGLASSMRPGMTKIGALLASAIRLVRSCTLVPTLSPKPHELPFHRVDVSDIGRDEVIAAALAGHHLKMAACEGGRRTRAAEMDEGREILLLAGSGLRLAGAGENVCDMAVQIDRRELDRMARDRADIEARETAAILHHRMIPDAGLCCLGVGTVGHLKQTDGARRRLVDCERIETPSPAPIGAVHRIARTLDLR